MNERLSSPAALRNRGPILAVLQAHLPASGVLLEVASGTGEHVIHFAEHLPGWFFQPSDIDPDRRRSIEAWAQGRGNIRPAVALDTTGAWPEGRIDAVLCCNMIHIAPWQAAIGLIEGAARVLRPQGKLMLYGPFRRDGAHTAPSNAAFDADLRHRNPSWGIRDLEAVASLANLAGFTAPEIVTMPANNFCLLFTFDPSPLIAVAHAPK